jgi:hypothetical protein
MGDRVIVQKYKTILHYISELSYGIGQDASDKTDGSI